MAAENKPESLRKIAGTQSSPRLHTLALAGVILLSVILFAELLFSARRQSQTFDEACHILAGYRYWQCKDFGMNPEHPPLVKLAATFPLLFLHVQPPAGVCGASVPWEQFRDARRFLYANDADAILLETRLLAATFTILLALLLFELAHRMFGVAPAFLALGLFVFEPNVLAHGALVTTDMGLTCCLFASVYAFYRYVQRPTTTGLLATGLATGLALSAKHSGILVLAILFLLAAAEILVRTLATGPARGIAMQLKSFGRHVVQLGASLLLVTGIAVGVIWVSYGFRYAARPADGKMTSHLTEKLRSMRTPVGGAPILADVISALERRRALPESYLYGLEDVFIKSSSGGRAFLVGKLYPQGQWFYFPVAFTIKSTLGFLLLLLVTILAVRELCQRATLREILFLGLPPAFYLGVSMTSHLNIGLRHILPIYPFLIVLTAYGACVVARRHRIWASIVLVLLAAHIFSSLRSFPDYLTYSNELWGGPKRTYRFLSDSNVDWGQSLQAAKEYLSQNGITECWFAYFGTADPNYYALPCKQLPSAFGGDPSYPLPHQVRGTLLISATELSGLYWKHAEHNPYRQFQSLHPVANIGGSILVYQGQFEFKWDSSAGEAPFYGFTSAPNHLSSAPK